MTKTLFHCNLFSVKFKRLSKVILIIKATSQGVRICVSIEFTKKDSYLIITTFPFALFNTALAVFNSFLQNRSSIFQSLHENSCAAVSF